MLQQLWSEFRRPHRIERRAANARVWQTLSPSLQNPEQILGRQQPGCVATHSVHERCDFSCTACYLSNTANKTPPLPFEEVRAQLDHMRAHLGEQGNVQITAGEVTLLPAEDLCRIIRYANGIGLSPMVMTHGERFRDEPHYLERLMTEGGLQKVAIHIDTTQKGRRDLKPHHHEPDIHFIRDEFANIIRAARKKTGLPLAASHTFTVTEKNLPHVPSVLRWCHKNADAFRMLSFQPTAATGRTRTKSVANKRTQLWSKICSGANAPLNPQAMLFGHPKCTQVNLHFIVQFANETHTIEVNRHHQPRDQKFWRTLMNSTFSGFSADGLTPPQSIANMLGRLHQSPRLLAQILRYCAYRTYTERTWLPRLLTHAALGRPFTIHPFVIVVHHFMDATELPTPEGQERLAACAFRVPVAGTMVPMCELNGTQMRSDLNQETRLRLVPESKELELESELRSLRHC